MFCAQVNCLGSWLGSRWAGLLSYDRTTGCLSQALGLDAHASSAALRPDPAPALLSVLTAGPSLLPLQKSLLEDPDFADSVLGP